MEGEEDYEGIEMEEDIKSSKPNKQSIIG